MNILNDGLLMGQILGGGRRPDPLRALIASLYGDGQQGAMFIPKPPVLGQQVLFQDSDGTTPVTADGDPVGLMLDISGRGNHASQETSARRPIYRTDGSISWVAGDGIDDGLVVPDYFVRDADQFMSFAIRMGAPKLLRYLAGGDRDSYLGVILDEVAGQARLRPYVRTTSGTDASDGAGRIATGQIAIISLRWTRSTGLFECYLDGQLDSSFSATPADIAPRATTSQYGLLYRTGSVDQPLNADLIGAVMVSGTVDDTLRASAESYLSQLAGVTLP